MSNRRNGLEVPRAADEAVSEVVIDGAVEAEEAVEAIGEVVADGAEARGIPTEAAGTGVSNNTTDVGFGLRRLLSKISPILLFFIFQKNYIYFYSHILTVGRSRLTVG